VADRAGKA